MQERQKKADEKATSVRGDGVAGSGSLAALHSSPPARSVVLLPPFLFCKCVCVALYVASHPLSDVLICSVLQWIKIALFALQGKKIPACVQIVIFTESRGNKTHTCWFIMHFLVSI